MGRPTGLEPATPRFTILCSNQLSYDRRKNCERGISRRLSVLSISCSRVVATEPWGPLIVSAGTLLNPSRGGAGVGG